MFQKVINKYITAKANDKIGELLVYGDISDTKWYDEDVTVRDITNALKDMGDVTQIDLRINSYGGSVFAGNAIFNILDRYRQNTGCKINAYVDGLAASMASGIAMVADKVYMAENSLLMLHKPIAMAYGNADDFEKQINMLNKAEETLISNYMRHFNGTEEELKNILKEETWFTAEEALAVGLCDEIVEAVEMVASAKGIVINGEEFSDNKIKDRYPNVKRGEPENMFEYDAKLEQYGISNEAFKQMNVSAETLLGIADTAKASFLSSFENGSVIVTDSEVEDGYLMGEGVFVPIEQIKDALGEDKTIEEVINLAKQGTQFNAEDSAKAKAYDGIVSDAIEAAIANGVRAKGENFNESKWRKILSNLDYADILDQSSEWDADAKLAMNAGKKVSETVPVGTVNDKDSINPEDYVF